MAEGITNRYTFLKSAFQKNEYKNSYMKHTSIDWLTDWLTHLLIDSLIDWLAIAWLTDWWTQQLIDSLLVVLRVPVRSMWRGSELSAAKERARGRRGRRLLSTEGIDCCSTSRSQEKIISDPAKQFDLYAIRHDSVQTTN